MSHPAPTVPFEWTARARLLVLSSHFRHTAPVTSARVGYREVLAVREFRGLLISRALSSVGDQIARIAVALLVLERSGSAFAAAATYAVSYLTWLLGGPLLSGLPDRYPRRRVIVVSDVTRGALVACLAVPGVPLWMLFAVLITVGLLAPPADAARSALLADVLDGEPYVVASALGNALEQAGQVGGFVLGGVLVSLVGVEGALLADAATFGVSAALLVLMVVERPVTHDITMSGRLLVEAAAGARLVWGTGRLRTLLAWGLLTAASVIVTEGLAVAVTAEQGGGPVAAGVLTAAVPTGFLIGSWALLRVPSDRRERLFPALVALTCLPLLTTPLIDNLILLTAVWVVAGTGNALQLVANAAFVQAVPAHLRGRAFGVAATLLMGLQGVLLLAAGALAEATDPRFTVAAVALVALLLMPLLVSPPQVLAILRRGSRG